ncbi:T9SS type A sorting domain-containing protein [Seonamhaeicola marinus]|uniref:T9SS type A sorting domain-containing protein n=1 Tax=Seonamhaeicola marinus TaxID=1912246 RepID=A0A5D0HTQ7_9FLAO|nr:T9SS type A sorting domain-containing protein [Seonamhaeicola marinus]TYA74698.1 T9SS type A sorting domain-containing protein [Seonamhaeicola marinus]
MKKKVLLTTLASCTLITFLVVNLRNSNSTNPISLDKTTLKFQKQNNTKKTLEEKALYNEKRNLQEYYKQVNPNTQSISKAEKKQELKQAQGANVKLLTNLTAKVPQAAYVNRGPSNFGGRTRALVIDRSDASGNTMIAGGVSGGVFRTTNGGATWTKVSANDEIHNVTSIVQDPRAGFEDTWYYATGEALGNSAVNGAWFYGDGIWQSTNGGITWSQIPSTDSAHEGGFNSRFDLISKLAVHPTTGHLYAAVIGEIRRFDGTSWTTELSDGLSTTAQVTDIVITNNGRIYAGFSGYHSASREGVWTSATGIGSWSRINDNGVDPADFTPFGRVVLALAPSDQDLLYVLFENGNTADCSTDTQEADLWRWDQGTTTFTDYSSVLPSEGCDTDGNPSDAGNNPFSVQNGYDLVVSVKPDNANFVIIGGTNVYKKENITDSGSRFTRIGGYISNTSYGKYANHHPDIHALVFNPSNVNTNVLLTGTDGGIHRTDDITAATVAWTSLNNSYQTFQFYHVNIDPLDTSDGVIGGSQDNGTTYGGTSFSLANLTSHFDYFSGDGGACAISRDNACVPFFFSSQSGSIYKDCPSFSEITPDSSPGSKFVTYFHLDPDNNNALYYAARGNLFRTTDATNVTPSTWTNLGSPTGFGSTNRNSDGSPVNSEEWFEVFSTTRSTYNASTSYLLMGGDFGHILRINDPQNVTDLSTAVDITPNGATTTWPSIVTGLAIHPSNPDIVLATYSNYGITNIFLTTNATDVSPTWTPVESNLSLHSIRSAAITEVGGQTLYFVGTARGLYSSTDPTVVTDAWVREAPTEIGYAVVSSLAYRPSDSHLLIGTHGNGMFEATVSDVLSIDDVNDISDEIALFPNPATTTINVGVPAAKNDLKYAIINVSGKLITKGTTENNQINVSYLTAGIYFIQLDIDGKTGVKKFVIQNN